ncbi:MAG: 3-dehydroquinate synthase [Candidatus Omnitrophica bacterium]|nr:3-dehydroquinate synthase [Candidatus Omnitrophota bacterium]MCG2705483.1 3-dehydroquinate synthase [Candidatus Omnitrophota bacterium]
MKEIKVNLGRNSYKIKIGHGILKKSGLYISRLNIGDNAVIITNPKINRLYGRTLRESLKKNGISVHTEMVPDSETSKSPKTFFSLINKIAHADKGKKPFIIAFGGGVVGDLAGFVAAVYRRGVPLIEIPTTLLAQVDSSIGGKVAIDAPFAKNMVGAFYQPSIVISDTSSLKSLPKREIKCGLSEIIKYSVIDSRSFFNFLSENIDSIIRLNKTKMEYTIKKCCAIKAKIVSKDEKDVKGVRAALNYGHTIGHAIESASGYTGLYNHGEAVAIGMLAAANISNKLGMLSEKDASSINSLVSRAGLPTKIKNIKLKKIMDAELHDKKFTEGVNAFVLPVRIGKVAVVKNISENIIEESVRELIV